MAKNKSQTEQNIFNSLELFSDRAWTFFTKYFVLDWTTGPGFFINKICFGPDL